VSDKRLISLKKLIETFRHERNFSERELSQKAGLNPATLNSFLNNADQDGRLTSLFGIADALGVSPAFLLATPEERSLLRAPSTPSFMEGVTRQFRAIEKRLEAIEHVRRPDPAGDAQSQEPIPEALARSLGFDSAQDAIETYEREGLLPEGKKPPGNKGSKKSG
jgi:transcriptional regulator with XRE-family HTH domain